MSKGIGILNVVISDVSELGVPLSSQVVVKCNVLHNGRWTPNVTSYFEQDKFRAVNVCRPLLEVFVIYKNRPFLVITVFEHLDKLIKQVVRVVIWA